MPPPISRGSGRCDPARLAAVGARTVIEDGVRIFNPEHVRLGDDVYVGHDTVLAGDTRAELLVGSGSWIGPFCYLQSAGGITIGQRVGIGARVSIISSAHAETEPPTPIMDGALEFAAVTVGDGSDVGIGAVLLPGAWLGKGVQVGAGAVVRDQFEDGVVVAGVPGRVLRSRRTGSSSPMTRASAHR